MAEPNDRALHGKQIRLIDENNEQRGIVSFAEAQEAARQSGLDLVVVAEKADPVVCRLMDYGKYVYEEKRRQREGRKKQHVQRVKEVKFHVNIDKHDLEIKLKHAFEFLKKGDKVKLSLFFRGREMSRTEAGMDLMREIVDRFRDTAQVDMEPKLSGRMITAIISPQSQKKK